MALRIVTNRLLQVETTDIAPQAIEQGEIVTVQFNQRAKTLTILLRDRFVLQKQQPLYTTVEVILTRNKYKNYVKTQYDDVHNKGIVKLYLNKRDYSTYQKMFQ